jgi:hypothetical protein
MEVKIKIIAETETPEVVEDAVSMLETMMPFIFDNVIVTSWVGPYEDKNSQSEVPSPEVGE